VGGTTADAPIFLCLNVTGLQTGNRGYELSCRDDSNYIMFAKIKELEDRFMQLEGDLSRPEIIKDQKNYQKFTKEHSQLSPIINTFRKYNAVQEEIQNNKSLLDDPDPEMKRLAKEEIESLKGELLQLEKDLKLQLLPKDPNDEKNIILEIRAGTGGEEAALFAADLFRAYLKYAEMRRWKTDIMSRSNTGIGGLKEIIVLIEGQDVYSHLKFESGVHRVQRVPETEAQGRVHTSAVTVAVLPEAEEVDVKVNMEDLRIDTYRSSGCGGQHINVTDSAIRITHLPTGLVVTCQDEKSQHKNKAKALKVLRSRLLDMEQEEQRAKISEQRKNMVGTGDRSERIRTYNFPQARVTDHRIGLTLYKLEDVMNGNLDQVIDPLIAYFQAEALKGEA
jgi:peptide chain release factor 1